LLLLDVGELKLEVSTVHWTNPNLSTIASWNKNKRWSHVSSGNSEIKISTYSLQQYNKQKLPSTITT
jgi:hypothetical protein